MAGEAEEKSVTEEMFEEGLKKLMDKYEVHLAFYLASLKKFKLLNFQERRELKGFLHILMNQLILLDIEEEDAEEERK